MVQYEARTRAACDQRLDLLDLTTRDAEIEGEPAFADVLHSAHEGVLQREPALVPLDVLPHADDERVGLKPVQRGAAFALVQQVDECHDTEDARLVGGKAGDPIDLALALARKAVGLHEYHRPHSSVRERTEVLRKKGALQCGRALVPRIVQLRRIPEMDVGVDHIRPSHSAHASAERAAAAERSAHVARARSSATARTMITPMMISWM